MTATDLPLQLLLAALLGGLVGAQRQASHKPAGFRTHLLVSLGSCAFMEASRLLGDDRIAANVITGIGFLGAGAIVRIGLGARGLTTAASIWTTAAIGLATGIGTLAAYLLAGVTSLLTLSALAFSDHNVETFFPHHDELHALVTFDLDALSLEHLLAACEREGLAPQATSDVSVTRGDGPPMMNAAVLVHLRDRARIPRILTSLARLPGVHKVAIKELSTFA